MVIIHLDWILLGFGNEILDIVVVDRLLMSFTFCNVKNLGSLENRVMD